MLSAREFVRRKQRRAGATGEGLLSPVDFKLNGLEDFMAPDTGYTLRGQE